MKSPTRTTWDKCNICVVRYLRGTYKFDKRVSQVLPHAMLRAFQTHIHSVSELVCIGYGVGDIHINDVLRHWLERNPERRLDIVNPYIEDTPSFLLHVAPQVLLKKTRTSDYLDHAAGIVRDETDTLEKRLGSWIRKQPDKQAANREFADFLSDYIQHRGRGFVERLAKAHLSEDNDAINVLRGEALSDVSCHRDACLKAFLENRSPVLTATSAQQGQIPVPSNCSAHCQS